MKACRKAHCERPAKTKGLCPHHYKVQRLAIGAFHTKGPHCKPDFTGRPISEVADELGLTYRQVNHWVSQDYIRGTYHHTDGCAVNAATLALGNGSGYVFRIKPSEEYVLRIMASLVKIGVMAGHAAELAEQMALAEDGSVSLGSVVLSLGRAS